jgi:outer membrane protein
MKSGLFRTRAILAAAAAISALSAAGAQDRSGEAAGDGARAYAGSLPDGTPGTYAGVDTPPPVTTFVDALDRAYWTNPGLLADRARLRGSDYRVAAARAMAGPTVSFDARYGYSFNRSVDFLGTSYVDRTNWTPTFSAIMSQPVFTFGRIASEKRSADAQVEYQRAVLSSTEEETMFNAIGAYAAVLRDRGAVRIAGEYLSTLERELQDNAYRLQKREVTSTDVQQVQTRLELSREQLLSASRTLASSVTRFYQVVGAAPGDLEQPNPLVIPVRGLEEAYAYAERTNPVVAAATAREKISRAQRDAAKAELMPRVDLRGQASTGSSVTSFSDKFVQKEMRGEVVATWTPFDSGLRLARLHEAEASNDADWRLIDAALRENRSQIADAWNLWKTQTAALDRLQAAMDSATRAYEGAVLQERAGLRTTLDVLDLSRDLLTAKSNYNAATTTAYVAQARLLAAMGLLEHSDLLPQADGYDPRPHADRVKGQGGIPGFSPAIQALDGVLQGPSNDRPVRDPASKVIIPPASTSTSPTKTTGQMLPKLP